MIDLRRWAQQLILNGHTDALTEERKKMKQNGLATTCPSSRLASSQTATPPGRHLPDLVQDEAEKRNTMGRKRTLTERQTRSLVVQSTVLARISIYDFFLFASLSGMFIHRPVLLLLQLMLAVHKLGSRTTFQGKWSIVTDVRLPDIRLPLLERPTLVPHSIVLQFSALFFCLLLDRLLMFRAPP